MACLEIDFVPGDRKIFTYDANEFLGPVLGQLSWLDSSFYPLFKNTNGKISGLVWVERYNHMFSFGEPIALQVDIQGNVQSVDTEIFEQWIGLPKNERIRMQELFLEKMRSEGATEAIP